MAINLPPKAQCGVGTACHGCGRRLPLHLTERDEEASLWECVHCHTPFAGALSPEVLRMLSRRIRLAALHFDIEQAEPLTDAVLQVVWRNASRAQRDANRDIRRSRRVAGQREVSPCDSTSGISSRANRSMAWWPIFRGTDRCWSRRHNCIRRRF